MLHKSIIRLWTKDAHTFADSKKTRFDLKRPAAICDMIRHRILTQYEYQVLIVEYSLAAGVRAKADRFRLRLGGWSDQNLAAMITASKGPDEDCDVKAERLRVDEAMTRARREGNGRGARHDDTNTVLIRGLTKVQAPRHKRLVIFTTVLFVSSCWRF